MKNYDKIHREYKISNFQFGQFGTIKLNFKNNLVDIKVKFQRYSSKTFIIK